MSQIDTTRITRPIFGSISVSGSSIATTGFSFTIKLVDGSYRILLVADRVDVDGTPSVTEIVGADQFQSLAAARDALAETVAPFFEAAAGMRPRSAPLH
ncbi:hypothetical protein H8Z72_23430 (plasmid) [Xanthomonas citri pv. citri]|uniref:hypothetical protein n=1 Tax=Xanthomonas citri TaxID=346 RepID=UPI0019325A36|nr:hypothetical protein [Xanthomonas citri]QRD62733.1 hypothetical protein H8Z74_22755 [Xanthomonas citri pv. citri]QRD67060.1 hypothetical protein H8Z73_22840 [Xanthomonas citri pv. citri]QRD71687.1 hypothetical protein H8Z72_23430 [Xanthomonas citri pv. citri]